MDNGSEWSSMPHFVPEIQLPQEGQWEMEAVYHVSIHLQVLNTGNGDIFDLFPIFWCVTHNQISAFQLSEDPVPVRWMVLSGSKSMMMTCYIVIPKQRPVISNANPIFGILWGENKALTKKLFPWQTFFFYPKVANNRQGNCLARGRYSRNRMNMHIFLSVFLLFLSLFFLSSFTSLAGSHYLALFLREVAMWLGGG